MRRCLRRLSGKKALERWLATELPRSDLIAGYSVSAYTDHNGGPVMGISVVPANKALRDVERRWRLFNCNNNFTTKPGCRPSSLSG